jgi:broad specificity phosphatase PhoE
VFLNSEKFVSNRNEIRLIVSGYLTPADLKLQYPLVDEDYEPALIPDKSEATGHDCIERVQTCVKKIRDNYSGSILFVSHGACISAMLELWIGYPKKVGMCTLCELEPEDQGNYRPLLIGCDRHIGDKSNLRAGW